MGEVVKVELVKPTSTHVLPALIANEGDRARKRFVEFFTAQIRDKNIRAAYAHATAQLLRWCEERSR